MFVSLLFKFQAYVAHYTASFLSQLLWTRRAPLAGEKVSPEWLTDVLVSLKELSNERYVTHIVEHDMLELHYDDENVGDAPRSLVLKYSAPTVYGRRNVIVQQSWREAAVLNSTGELGQAVAPLCLPVYHASGNKFLGEYVILLGDAAQLDYTGVNKCFGDQVFGDDNENISGDEAVQRQLALLEKWWCGSAKFHAQFWQRHLQLAKEYPYLRGADWVFGNGRLRWQQSLEASKRHWKTALKRTDLSLDQRLVTLIDRALAGSSWHVFQQRLNSAPITITHGDFHASNMFVQLGSDPKFAWIDWSETGFFHAAADLGQSLISDVKAPLFPLVKKRLLRAYWETLNKKDYEFRDFEADFSRATLERWLFFFTVLAAMPLPAALINYFNDQIVAFVETFGDWDETYSFTAMVALTD